jgi:hypothetical protein
MNFRGGNLLDEPDWALPNSTPFWPCPLGWVEGMRIA